VESVTQLTETQPKVGNTLHVGLNRTKPLPQAGEGRFFLWRRVLSILIISSSADILRMAIGQEKDSIVFYTGLKEMISQTSGRVRIEEIIKQEMGHIGFLHREIAALSSNVR